jgi:rhamnose transport system substrate-binding protein
MPVNFDVVGAAQLELMGTLMDYRGQFAILSAEEEAPDQSAWVERIKEELESNPRYSGMELVDLVYGDDHAEKSVDEARGLLKRWPNLRGILAPTTVGIVAAAKATREQGLQGKVKVTGLGLPSEMAEFVLDGTCERFQLWNPPYEGYIGVCLVWAEKKEGFVPVPGASFSAGMLGSRVVLPNNRILTLETPISYDRSNIREYSVLF